MSGYILDGACQIQCPHGGMVTVMPKVTKVRVGASPPLVVDDTMTIVGCSFAPGAAASPCVKVTWSAPSVKVKAEGSAVLLSSSVGLCCNGPGAPQGPASVSGYQTKVKAT